MFANETHLKPWLSNSTPRCLIPRFTQPTRTNKFGFDGHQGERQRRLTGDKAMTDYPPNLFALLVIHFPTFAIVRRLVEAQL